MRVLAIMTLALLAGCSSFKLGSMSYCAYGMSCTMAVEVAESAASAAVAR